MDRTPWTSPSGAGAGAGAATSVAPSVSHQGRKVCAHHPRFQGLDALLSTPQPRRNFLRLLCQAGPPTPGTARLRPPRGSGPPGPRLTPSLWGRAPGAPRSVDTEGGAIFRHRHGCHVTGAAPAHRHPRKQTAGPRGVLSNHGVHRSVGCEVVSVRRQGCWLTSQRCLRLLRAALGELWTLSLGPTR